MSKHEPKTSYSSIVGAVWIDTPNACGCGHNEARLARPTAMKQTAGRRTWILTVVILVIAHGEF